MKKILILGAGIYQVPLIKTAKRLGVYSIVVSIPGNYPGFALADKVYYENTTDYEKILEIAKKEQIDGIVTAGTDVAVITIGKICDELGLTGLSCRAAEIATDKLRMKEVYEAHGVRSARYRKIYFDNSSFAEDISELSLPLMFKSVDSSGSRGIVKVTSKDQFASARETVKANTRSDYFIVEEFVAGTEFGAQAFVRGGEVKFILPHGDYVFVGDTGVPVGHYAPYELSAEVMDDMKKQLTGAIEAMELDNCAVNADFIMKDGQTYVLELGGRSGATCLAELTALYFDFDYYEKILLTALGENIDFEPGKAALICDAEGKTVFKGVPNASKLLMSDRDGHIASQENLNDSDDPDIVEVQFDYAPGDEVKKFHVGPNRIGHVICKGASLADAETKLEKALEKIHIVVE